MSNRAASVPATAGERKAKFLQGDLMRHVTVMALSASAGLISIFLVDFADLFFISLLGDAALTAAVGFAGALLFFNQSVTIGIMIAMGALAAQRIGRGQEEEARRIATSVAVAGVGLTSALAAIFWFGAPFFLELLGASGAAKSHAVGYMRIVVPSMPVMAFAMISSGFLRAHGDARRAMNATLTAGAVNAVLDPILIFAAGLGLEGAALASVAARFSMMGAAALPIFRHYGGFAPFDAGRLARHLRPIAAIAGPAILTNVATPVGIMAVTRLIAPFGDSAVAGFAVVNRLTPLAFCVLFALSGAVGPIVGQNFGARAFDRVRETLRKAVIFAGLYGLIAWAMLFALNGFIANAFGLTGDGRDIVFWFGAVVAPLFFFNGVLFVSNAAFNNMNRPLWSTFLNWGRNTLGVIPLAMLGGALAGAPGVIIGQGAGGLVFGLVGLWLAYRLAGAYESGAADPEKGWKVNLARPAASRASAPPPR